MTRSSQHGVGVVWRAAIAAAIAVTGLVAAACGDVTINIDADSERVAGSGEIVAEKRPIEDFERIVLAGEGRVEFAAGSDGFIEIETDENLLSRIETEVANATLTIRTEQDIDIDPSDGVVYRLGCPEIVEVRLSGSGTVDLSDCTTTDRLELELLGAGTIAARSLDLVVLDVSLPGAGSIEVEGQADRLEVSVAGVGGFDGEDLEAADAEVHSSGVGETSLWVTDDLELRVTGVGSVRYYGQPVVSQTISGVGTVESLGSK